METKAILLDGKDNVATCTSEAHPGDKVHFHGSGRLLGYHLYHRQGDAHGQCHCAGAEGHGQ